jgi:hypothetical protein
MLAARFLAGPDPPSTIKLNGISYHIGPLNAAPSEPGGIPADLLAAGRLAYHHIHMAFRLLELAGDREASEEQIRHLVQAVSRQEGSWLIAALDGQLALANRTGEAVKAGHVSASHAHEAAYLIALEVASEAKRGVQPFSVRDMDLRRLYDLVARETTAAAHDRAQRVLLGQPPPQSVGHGLEIVPLTPEAQALELPPVGPRAQAASAGSRPASRQRMTVAEANAKAGELLKRDHKKFVGLSRREQARQIGCSFGTWASTSLFRKLYPNADALAGQHSPAPKAAVGLPSDGAGGVPVGRPDEVLHQLAEAEERADRNREQELAQTIAEQMADDEPSPLVDDPGGRPRRVKCSKRR